MPACVGTIETLVDDRIAGIRRNDVAAANHEVALACL